jgi:hypothetical protein
LAHRRLAHDVAMTGDRLDGEIIRQSLNAWDEKPHQPCERDTHGATNAPPGKPLYQQAVAEAPLVIRDAVWLAARDKLASTGVAGMRLLAMVHVAVFLRLGRLAPWAHIFAHQGLLWTSSNQEAFWVNTSTEASDEHDMECTTPDSSSRLYKFNLHLRFGHEGVTAED